MTASALNHSAEEDFISSLNTFYNFTFQSFYSSPKLPGIHPKKQQDQTAAIMPEGRQSPPPERQTGAQQRDPPGSGQRTGNTEKGKSGKSQLEVCYIVE